MLVPNSVQRLVLELLERLDGAIEANPLEGRFLTVDGLALLDQTQRGEHVGDVVEPPDLCLELLLLLVVRIHVLLPLVDALGCLFQADDGLPSDEQMDEILTENTERLVFLILLDSATVD